MDMSKMRPDDPLRRPPKGSLDDVVGLMRQGGVVIDADQSGALAGAIWLRCESCNFRWLVKHGFTRAWLWIRCLDCRNPNDGWVE